MSTKSISPGVHDAWKQATESMLDDLRREGIGYLASCRFVSATNRPAPNGTKGKHETSSTDSSVRRQYDGQR